MSVGAELPRAAPEPPAAGPRRSRGERVVRGAAGSSFSWILFVLIALFTAFAVISPAGTFFSVFNLKNIGVDASTLLILASGATLVIVMGGLDLSVGSVLTFAAVVGTIVMKDVSAEGTERAGLAIALGVGAAIGSGLAWGAVNGTLIARFGLPPFVVTLGTLGAALGAARLLSNGTTVFGVPHALQEDVGLAELAGVPVPLVVAVAAMLVFGTVLARTQFGEHTYLVGSSEIAAARGGIRVARQRLAVYTISGGLAGLAAVIEVSRFEVATVATGHTTELIAVLAAVVIGGASLFGGGGTMTGTAGGVMIPTVLQNGFIINGVQRFWQDVAVGAILVGAVAFDQWRRKSELERG